VCADRLLSGAIRAAAMSDQTPLIPLASDAKVVLGLSQLAAGLLLCLPVTAHGAENPKTLERITVRAYYVTDGGSGLYIRRTPAMFMDFGGVGGGFSKGPAEGIDPGKDDDAQDPCESSGSPASETTSQPVDIATGTKLLHELDVSAGPADNALAILRTYRSTRTGSGMFGSRWSSTLEYTLSFEYPGQTCHGQLGGPLNCSASGNPVSVMVHDRVRAGRTFVAQGSDHWNHEDGSLLTRSGSNWFLGAVRRRCRRKRGSLLDCH